MSFPSPHHLLAATVLLLGLAQCSPRPSPTDLSHATAIERRQTTLQSFASLVPNPTTTSTATAASAPIPGESDAPLPTNAPKLFIIGTKIGTARADFDAFIKTLPDGGAGEVVAEDKVPWQSYVTSDLSTDDVSNISQNAIVDFVTPMSEDEGESGVLPISPTIQQKRAAPTTRPNADFHLGMISAAPTLKDTTSWGDYKFDPTHQGIGQTIYIIDAGFNTNHSELAESGRLIAPHVVPNRFTLEFHNDTSTHAPENINDISTDGHGTAVASVAGGILQGLASGVDMTLIKFRGAVRSLADPNRFVPVGVTDSALEAAFSFAIENVLEKRDAGNTGKFIINMSYGFEIPDQSNPDAFGKHRIMKRVLEFCETTDIVVIVPTGNAGLSGTTTDETTPQVLSTSMNSLFVVGGTINTGALWPNTNPANPGVDAGAITVYAGARDVVVADSSSDTATTTKSGTSFAAPAVAGIAAVFFSNSDFDSMWPTGQVAKSMHDFIRDTASVQRNNNPIPPGLRPGYPAPDPASVKAVYNLIEGPVNAAPATTAPATTTTTSLPAGCTIDTLSGTPATLCDMVTVPLGLTKRAATASIVAGSHAPSSVLASVVTAAA